jgi:hypothetical protein
LIIIAAIVAVGIVVLNRSSAATIPRAVILGPSNVVAAPGISVGGLTAGNINYVGAPQVIYVGPGAKLSFNQGVKGNVRHCYLVQVLPDKSGAGTATVRFASNNKVIARTISYNSADPGSLQQVCVGAGTVANPGYSIYDTSTTQGIIVYQDIVSY